MLVEDLMSVADLMGASGTRQRERAQVEDKGALLSSGSGCWLAGR